jgi:hypothetical protein
VHPIQVESVAWISERKNVLSGLFFFAAFYVYLSYSERGRIGRYLAVLALYLLALLSAARVGPWKCVLESTRPTRPTGGSVGASLKSCCVGKRRSAEAVRCP